MKTNELTIGDWARITDDDGCITKVFAGIVEAIDEIGNIYVKAPGDKTAYPYSIDCAEPIDLTSEILERNGFKDCEFFGKLLYKEWRILCDCSHLAMRHETGWMVDIPCHYVHELQHALRLCKLEIEIKL